jgi:hypothetical protein
LDPRYDQARQFVLGLGTFNNKMLVRTELKPTSEIRTAFQTFETGTVVVVDIFRFLVWVQS